MLILRRLFIVILMLFPIYLSASSKDDALKYINQLRQEAGLVALSNNTLLEIASQQHTDYLNEQNSNGHYENNSASSFYSGFSPVDRGESAGYHSFFYIENLSIGQKDIYASVDDLMSAIYHRYAFLNFSIDEIGIGINSDNIKRKIYNYDMGNSFISDICNNPDNYSPSASETSYYPGTICPNITDSSIEISPNAYNDALYHYSKTYSDYIVWPSKDSTNIRPVFFEESPDPLPDYSVSGYPVSIEFNDYKYKDDNITVTSFKLYEADGTEVTDTRELNGANDPNKEITGLEFVLFPLNRLKFNTKYKVVIHYSINNVPISNPIEWSFTTKSIGHPYYIVTDSTSTLNLKAGVTYALYYPPADHFDVIKSYNYSVTTTDDTIEPSIIFADQNTLLVTLSSNISSVTLYTSSNSATHNKTITLKVASTDTAILENETNNGGGTVQTATILTSSDIDSLSSGWSLLGTMHSITDLSIFDSAKIIWIYNHTTNLWGAYSSDEAVKEQIINNHSVELIESIPAKSGIWVFK